MKDSNYYHEKAQGYNLKMLIAVVLMFICSIVNWNYFAYFYAILSLTYAGLLNYSIWKRNEKHLEEKTNG